MTVSIQRQSINTGLALAAILIVALTSSQGDAKTNKACLATFQEPKITITVKEEKTRLIRSKSHKQITRIAKSQSSFEPSTEGRVLGLTDATQELQLGIEVESQPLNNGEHCVRLDRVKAIISMRKSDVYIAREYKAGSCAFKAILAHEQEHVAINKHFREKLVKELDKGLKKYARRVDPFIVPASYDAAEDIYERLSKVITPIREDINRERRNAHRKIDTPRSYRKVRSRCAKW
ncbi:MAG: hypothetical protein MI743_04625 [Sneathiellales bacterium]|nr:hypothetical protein [Sneathiellales bacterium]